MPEKIDPTWLAFALGQGQDEALLAAAFERVRFHYQELVDHPLSASTSVCQGAGVAVWGDAEPRCRWPHFTETGELTLATAYVPTGWQRLTGPASPASAAPALAEAILASPMRAIEQLTAPLVAAVLDRRSGELTVINDALGAGRCYELAFPGGTAWSNRLGALPLFAGVEVGPDERGWRLLSATSWFFGDALPMAGPTRVERGSCIRASRLRVDRQRSGALASLLGGSRLELGDAVELAADQAKEQANTAGELWDARAEVDLSGGRDSRVVAAAALAAGIDAHFHTSDKTPGEADVAVELIAAAPGSHKHRIRHQSDDASASTPDAPLAERALRLHLLHDGMRHPQKLRGDTKLPRGRPARASLSGHGGEIAHGFFYKTSRELKQLRRGGDEALEARLMRFFGKGHKAASDDAYELAELEVSGLLAEGREIGLEGPELLDWFYLIDRFTHRSGIASHAERISIFATPGFVRAAFSLTPEQRLEARLHGEVIARLVPSWAAIGYFQKPASGGETVTRRKRLWQNEPDVAAFRGMLEQEQAWSDLFDPAAVRSAWQQALTETINTSWESVFEAIVYRVAYDDYLSLINQRAAVGPSLCT